MAEKNSWSYKPDDSENLPGRPSQPTAGKTRRGPGDFSWSASEYINHQQSVGWFVGLAVVTALATVGVYLLTKDYFTLGVIPLTGIVLGIFAHRTPGQLSYTLSSDGLQIGGKSYPYSSFKSFSIISDGGLLSLYLEPIKRFMPPISAYFAPADHEKVFDILQNYLPYEERQLELTERLTRRLHF